MIIKNEDKWDDTFKYYAKFYNLDWLFLKAQVKQESLFNPKAVSRTGAKGLAQFMPRTWMEWADLSPGIQSTWQEHDPFDPKQSIAAQAAYVSFMKEYLSNYNVIPIMDWVLVAYNWGIGHVLGYKGHPGLIKKSKQLSEVLTYLPNETLTYINRINRYYIEYTELDLAKIESKGLDEIA